MLAFNHIVDVPLIVPHAKLSKEAVCAQLCSLVLWLSPASITLCNPCFCYADIARTHHTMQDVIVHLMVITCCRISHAKQQHRPELQVYAHLHLPKAQHGLFIIGGQLRADQHTTLPQGWTSLQKEQSDQQKQPDDMLGDSLQLKTADLDIADMVEEVLLPHDSDT